MGIWDNMAYDKSKNKKKVEESSLYSDLVFGFDEDCYCRSYKVFSCYQKI